MIRDRILAILAAQALLRPEDLRLDARPDELGLDSLALVEAIFALEEEFDIRIPFSAQTVGAQTVGAQTVGAQTVGAQTAGAQTAGTQTAGMQDGFDTSTIGSVVAAVEALVQR